MKYYALSSRRIFCSHDLAMEELIHITSDDVFLMGWMIDPIGR